MRVGYNPHKGKTVGASEYFHQVVIPVYIPTEDGYFKDSFAILKLCLESLLATVHSKTFISIVNNGSCIIVVDYLNDLYLRQKIQELVHTENIGKINAVLKGIVGNSIELVTIADSDVLFLPNWQIETVNVFKTVPKAGVVGIVPQFKMYEGYCGNVLFDSIFSLKLRFVPVKNKDALIRFYDSLGWDKNYNPDYLEFNLALEINPELSVLLGSGHFVATYKKDIFESVIAYIGYKMGGNSEGYLDTSPLKMDYWRVTTQDNYAYHMGNTIENWMKVSPVSNETETILSYGFPKNKRLNPFLYWIKNRLFAKFISIKILVKLFLKWKKLPKEMIQKY